KKTVGVFRGALAERVDIGAVGEKDVQLTVVVVVKDCHAPSHGFRRMTLGRFATVEFEVDGLIDKLDRAFARLVSCFRRSRRLCGGRKKERARQVQTQSWEQRQSGNRKSQLPFLHRKFTLYPRVHSQAGHTGGPL